MSVESENIAISLPDKELPLSVNSLYVRSYHSVKPKNGILGTARENYALLIHKRLFHPPDENAKFRRIRKVPYALPRTFMQGTEEPICLVLVNFAHFCPS
jgi:hypothetical protein